ncbi:MAG TPA: tetratricopeptide repeat protein [Nostocaceae cyanobacterium]|nr:tetratricopeptide repeat protein [Nostocaceae cyanobacterium]
MLIISIREVEKTADGFNAILRLNDGEYPIVISDPFTPREEARLEWYFEDWLRYPFIDNSIAAKAADSVKSYGENLFNQIFKDKNAYSIYSQHRGNLSQIQIEIIGKTPEFHALHWEAIKDPDLNRPLAVDCVMLRKNVTPVNIPANVQVSPVINVLVVVARPDQEKDIGYRTISRPLVELIENSQLRVNIELLRPGTFEALSKHLEAKGAGFYHVIHLDMHGGLLTFEQIQTPRRRGHFLSKGRYGRSDIKRFEGWKAFLSFEGENSGEVDLVEASELADLLTGKGVPVCIVDACQSAKQVKYDPQNSEGTAGENTDVEVRDTSLGSRLMSAGMQMVIAMSYSITVSASAMLMKEFYQHLFDSKLITEAIRLGRRELFNNRERQAYHNKFVELEDWLLPVVYCNQKVNLNLRRFDAEEEEKYWQSVGSQYRFPVPTYGFIGRDLEILKIEKALLKHNVLLLQGMGGTGKTTLLNYLREWWVKTNFVKDVFYFGYDQTAWTLSQILHEIGKQVFGKFEQANFQAMNLTAQVQKLAAKFRAENYGLILDNLESVTGQELAIQNTLPTTEQNQIRDFLGRLVGGKTLVVLGSRSREEWLQTATKYYIYELQGLDQQARTQLAEKILEQNIGDKKQIKKIREDENFRKLMKLLAGYPLAMEVVLANLRQQSPEEILQALQGAEVNLDVDSEDKTKSILKCVEYSHSNLSPTAQKLLLYLAPFSGFINRVVIPLYIEKLQKLEPFKDYLFDQFDAAIQEAINWGLLSPLDFSPNPSPMPRGEERLLTIQPIFPYFLKTKLASLEPATREALQEGFKNHYLVLAAFYQQLLESKDAQQRQWGILFCKLEYENLYHALQICLEKQERIKIYFCLNQYLDLIADNQNNLKLSEIVCQHLENYPNVFFKDELGYDIAFAISRLGICQIIEKQYQLAKKSYKKSIKIYENLEGIEQKKKKSLIAFNYHQLGRIAQDLREYEQAKRYYQQALNINIEYCERYSQASNYHGLGRVAEEMQEYQQAKHYYQQALDIFIEYGDRHSQAKIYQNLGILAQQMRKHEQAKAYFQQALDIKIEYGDRYYQASTYHGLGRLAQEMREYEQAKEYYQQALDIFIEYGDHYGQANTYHNLGMVAQDLQEYEQAQQYFQKALDIFIEYGDRYFQARTYHTLGMVAQELQEYEQTQQYFQKALDIFIEYGDHYFQASAYHRLGRLAQEMREYEQAQQYFQKALDIFIEYGDRYNHADTYTALGFLAAVQEDYSAARENLQKALEIFIEYQDEDKAAMTREILEGLPE